jgi:hypothetical protein
MYKSKLLDVIQVLSANERRGLRKYFDVKFVNKNDAIYKLFQFIDTRKTITPLTVKKERVFSYFYENETYNDQHIRHLMWLCLEIVEEYLVFHSFREDRNRQNLQLLAVYSEKRLSKYALEVHEKIKNRNHQLQFRDSVYYREQLEAEQMLYQIATDNNRFAALNLQTIIDKIGAYAVVETLRWSCIALSHQRISGVSYKFPLLENYLLAIEDGQFADDIAIQLYYLIYKVSMQEDDRSFETLFHSLIHLEQHFTDTEIRDIFLLVINYCIRRMNVGQQKYARYAFDLYMHALDKKYLLEHQQLDRFTFKNIAFIAIKQLKEFQLAEDFIVKYQIYLAEEYREDTVHFTKATLYFEQKNYVKAMRILQQVEFSDMLWNLNAKNMLLKMYFETAEYDLMHSFLETYYRYLKRQKQIGYHKTRYLKVVAMFRKLYKSLGATTSERKKLKSILENDLQLPEKEWFLAQI